MPSEPLSPQELEALTHRQLTAEAEASRNRARRSSAGLGVLALVLFVGAAIVTAQLGGLFAGAGRPSQSASGGLTGDATPSPSQAAAPASSAPAVAMPSASPSLSPSPTVTRTAEPTPTPRPPATTTPRPTQRPTPNPTRQPTPTPTPKPTPTPSPTPKPTPTPTPTPSPTPTPCAPSLAAVPDPVRFEKGDDRKSLTIVATGCPGPVSFTIEDDRDWLRTDPTSGTLSSGVPVVVDVVVIRSRMSRGLNVGHLTITSGTSSVEVTVEAKD